MLNIEIEEVIRNHKLLSAYLEQNEVRNNLIERGIKIAPYSYQLECQMERYQIIEDNFDSVRVKDPQCWGCPLKEKRGLKKCFRVVTKMDLLEFFRTKKIPPFKKGEEIIYKAIM